MIKFRVAAVRRAIGSVELEVIESPSAGCDNYRCSATGESPLSPNFRLVFRRGDPMYEKASKVELEAELELKF